MTEASRLLAAILLFAGCRLLFDVDDNRSREDTIATCSDGADNDGDGKIDCEDEGCRGLPVCASDGGGLPSHCGDGNLDPDEFCDTGIPSGQPGACPSSCDDGNTCTVDRLIGRGTCLDTCVHEPILNCCGNGMLESGEACDDGNQSDFDGCSADCLHERAVVLTAVTFLDGSQGCDLTGDGVIDNAFGGAMNATGRMFFSEVINNSDLHECPLVSLWLFRGSDATMKGDFSLSFLAGIGTEMPPNEAAYFSGSNPFFVIPLDLDMRGQPATSLSGAAPMGNLLTNLGDVGEPFPWCLLQGLHYVQVDYHKLRLEGTLVSNPEALESFSGQLCGARSAASWHRVPNSGGFGGRTVLDLLVSGATFFGFHSDPTQPDIDFDGDGLERLVDADGDGNVDLCIDGNGSQVEGIDCPLDPRIADGYSEAMSLEAIGARLAGLQR